MSLEKKAQEFFEANPATEQVHYTSDGFAFVHKPNAIDHAATLEEKEIKTFTNKGQDESAEEQKPKAVKKAKKTEQEKETE